MKNGKSKNRISVLALAAFALALPLTPQSAASGGSSAPEPKTVETPADQAIAHYNSGLAARDRAWKQQDKLAVAGDAEKAKLEKKIRQSYEQAIREYRQAIANNPKMVEAYSSLGYALRKTDDYSAALTAYNAALELNPEYTEALEYRGEAWLGLNQPDKAKADYTVLVGLNKQHAAELLHSMKNWIASGRAADSVDQAKLTDLGVWVAEELVAIGDLAKNKNRKGDW